MKLNAFFGRNSNRAWESGHLASLSNVYLTCTLHRPHFSLKSGMGSVTKTWTASLWKPTHRIPMMNYLLFGLVFDAYTFSTHPQNLLRWNNMAVFFLQYIYPNIIWNSMLCYKLFRYLLINIDLVKLNAVSVGIMWFWWLTKYECGKFVSEWKSNRKMLMPC